jgi:ABC-2 type transport system permease protein
MGRHIVAMVRKDLLVFFSDRRAMLMSFVVPITIASFFGSLYSGPSQQLEQTKILIMVVDQDQSVISKEIVAGLQGDENLNVATASPEDARAEVRRGRIRAAIIIPNGFGDHVARAFLSRREKPRIDVVFDPSRTTELAIVRGVLRGHVSEAVRREMFGGTRGRELVAETLRGLDSAQMPDDQKRLLRTMFESLQRFYQRDQSAASADRPQNDLTPYTIREEPMTAGSNIAYNGYAHSFAGMGIQFLLFTMANVGVEMLLERQRGLWKRVRSAPVSRFALLAGRAVSGTLVSLMILAVSFAFAIIVFGVRIEGSVLGFLAVSLACAVMAATFGVLIAAVCNTPATARGVTTLVILMMSMLGGAWVPTFIFPTWLQRAGLILPVRWAVDGLDAMTWRGIGFSGALGPVLVLVGFAILFGAVAAARFRWEEV